MRIAKKLKKNNVAVDIISFGSDDAENGPKLEAFIAAINSSDNSHLVHHYTQALFLLWSKCLLGGCQAWKQHQQGCLLSCQWTPADCMSDDKTSNRQLRQLIEM